MGVADLSDRAVIGRSIVKNVGLQFGNNARAHVHRRKIVGDIVIDNVADDFAETVW